MMPMLTRTLRRHAAGIPAALAVLTCLAYSQDLFAQGIIDHSNGFTNQNDMTLNGGAAVVGSNLQMTTTGTNQGRTAFFTTQEPVGSWQTRFKFHQLPGSNPLADGLCFIVQADAVAKAGPTGGGLGYGPDTDATAPSATDIQKSICVKFDLYSNNGEGINSTGIFVDGNAPTVANAVVDQLNVDLTGSVIDLHSGHEFSVFMNYDGTTLTEIITDLNTGKSFTQAYPIVIANHTMQANAWFGFGGGTGGLTALQEIEQWAYSTQLMPTGVMTTPGPNHVTLNWAAPTGATSYSVFRSNTSGGPYTLLQSGIAGLMYVDLTPTFPNTYYYVVVASNGVVTSIYSDEVPGTPTQPIITVTPTALQVPENGGMASFTVTLVNSPSGQVTVPLTSANSAQLEFLSGGVDVPSLNLIFPANAVGPALTQTVTVVAQNQGTEGPPPTYTVLVNFGTVTCTDAASPYQNYNSDGIDIPPVTVTIVADAAGILANPASIATVNGGLAVQFNVSLATVPKGTVVLNLAVSDPALATVSPTQITTAGYNTAVTVTVTPLNANPQTTYIGPYDIVITVDPTSTDPDYLALGPTDVPVSTPISVPPLDHVWKCGLVGAESVLALGLLAFWRRRRR
jgi:hypothetical protein